MPRARILKPELWSSQTLAKVSIEAEHMFTGLWNFADDYGVLLDAPRRIWGDLFPYREEVTLAKVKAWIEELLAVGVIFRATVAKQSYLIVRNWDEHQRVNHPSKQRHLSDKDLREALESLKRASRESQETLPLVVGVGVVVEGVGEVGVEPNPSKPSVPAIEKMEKSDPLEKLPTLKDWFPKLVQMFNRVFAREPMNGQQSHNKARTELDRIARLDNFGEHEIIDTLTWWLESQDPEADFWRVNCRTVHSLRKKKNDGTKFAQMFAKSKQGPRVDRGEVKPRPVVKDRKQDDMPF